MRYNSQCNIILQKNMSQQKKKAIVNLGPLSEWEAKKALAAKIKENINKLIPGEMAKKLAIYEYKLDNIISSSPITEGELKDYELYYEVMANKAVYTELYDKSPQASYNIHKLCLIADYDFGGMSAFCEIAKEHAKESEYSF